MWHLNGNREVMNRGAEVVQKDIVTTILYLCLIEVSAVSIIANRFKMTFNQTQFIVLQEKGSNVFL